MHLSLGRESCNRDRCAVVRENNAASLAEKSADKASIAISAPIAKSHAIGLTSFTIGNLHFPQVAVYSSSAVLDLPKAKSNSLSAGIIMAAVANA